MRKHVRLIFTLLALVCALAIMVPLASKAATAANSRSVSFNKSWTFKSKPLGFCVIFDVKGSIQFSTAPGRNEVTYTNQKLTNPTLSVSVRTYNGSACGSLSPVTKISLGQNWTGYGCNYNPSISVNIPWGISLTGWPSCGSRKQAEHHSSYGAGRGFTQNNSGSPTAFGNYTAWSPKFSPPCYGVYVNATAYKRNASDAFSSSAQQVCL